MIEKKLSLTYSRMLGKTLANKIMPGSNIFDIEFKNYKLANELDFLSYKCFAGEGLVSLESAFNKVELITGAFLTTPPIRYYEPDVILATHLLQDSPDIHLSLEALRNWTKPKTRIIFASYSRLWFPLIKLAECLRLREIGARSNWVQSNDIHNLLDQAGIEIIEKSRHIICPIPIPIVANFLNKYIAPLPLFRHLCSTTVIVARAREIKRRNSDPSLTIVIPARNEMGNIEELIRRIPKIAPNQEIIFVEGNSTDGTWSEINKQIGDRQFFERGITLSSLKQFGKGKGDAVRRGFDSATGEVLMILDADISVQPEELGKFYNLIASGYCEFANGSRLVYPMEEGAMRFLNLIGNKFFGRLFSFLIRQPVGDTLCGTKVLWKTDYARIAGSRNHFGDFDPFGDFDLLFGAARLHLKIVDVPVHYKERKYGSTNISRFRHGVLLFKMSFVAARKLLFVA